jgi:hypothetical protein
MRMGTSFCVIHSLDRWKDLFYLANAAIFSAKPTGYGSPEPGRNA